MAPRETENNAYAKFWGDKQRTLWYVMIFLEWSIAFVSLMTVGFISVHCSVFGLAGKFLLIQV